MPSAADDPAAAATLLASSRASSKLVGFIFQLPPVIGCLAINAEAGLAGAAGATRPVAGAKARAATSAADLAIANTDEIEIRRATCVANRAA